MNKRIRYLLILSLLLFVCEAQGTHYMGGEIYYECLGGNQYRVTMKVYRDCAGVTMSTSHRISITSAACSQNLSLNLSLVSSREVSPLCTTDLSNSSCNGGTLPGVEEYIFQNVITLPAECTDWIFSGNFQNRNNAITNLQNPGDQSMYIRTTLNNSGGICNDSPVFTNLPVPFICNNQLFDYNHGAVDSEGDVLVYSLVNPMRANGVPITFQPGFSTGYPINTSSGAFSVNPSTGAISFTPNGIQVAVLAVKVDEYRNGVLIGSVMRDMQVIVRNCTNDPPRLTNGGISNFTGGGTLVDNNSVLVCPGETLSFRIVIDDINAANTVTALSNLATSIPGATLTTSGTNPVTANFTWTPAASDVGLKTFTINGRDNACPTPVSQIFTFDIDVRSGITAGPDRSYCASGSPVQLNATGGTSFVWSPSTGLSCTNCQNPLASPTVTTTYTVTSNVAGGCSSTDQVTVSVLNGSDINTGAISGPTPICQGKSGVYSVSNTAGSSYAWTVPAGATITGGQGSNSITVVWVSTGGVVRVVETRSGSGCTVGAPVEYTVNVGGPSAGVISGPTSFCKVSASDCNYTSYAITGPATTGWPPQNPPPAGFSYYHWEAVAGTPQFMFGSTPQGSRNMDIQFCNYVGPVVLSVTQTDDQGCVYEPVTYEIDVQARPATPALSGPNPVCPYDTVAFDVTSGGDHYIWDFGIPASGITVLSGDGSNHVEVKWGNVSQCVRVFAGIPGCESYGSGQICNVNVDPLNFNDLRLEPLVYPGCNIDFQIFQDYCPCLAGSQVWTVPAGFTVVSGGNGTNSITLRQNPATCSEGEICFTARNSTGCPLTKCIIIPSGPLPVEYVNIDLKENATGNVVIVWNTSDEKNNERFEVERSEDGINFEVVGVVQGAGSSGSINSYQWIDSSPPSGVVYYRIVQYDFNGTVSRSSLEAITRSNSEEVFVAPNPFEGETEIQLSGGKAQSFIQIVDVRGKEVLYSDNTSEKITFGKNLPAGVYILKFYNGEHQQTYQLVKVR